MTRLPRSIYLDIDPGRGAKPRAIGAKTQALRLVPPVNATGVARAPRATTPVEVRAPAPEPVAAVQSVAPPRAATENSPSIAARDLQIISVLDEPAAIGESADALYRRKEHELGALFATLSASDAVALAKRLSTEATGDTLSARFSRLVADRRQRLIDFLVDAKRRQAIANARQPRSASTRMNGSPP